MGKEIGMKKIEETMPSESEWLIMEVLWESGTPLTSMEVLNRLQGRSYKRSSRPAARRHIDRRAD